MSTFILNLRKRESDYITKRDIENLEVLIKKYPIRDISKIIRQSKHIYQDIVEMLSSTIGPIKINKPEMIITSNSLDNIIQIEDLFQLPIFKYYTIYSDSSSLCDIDYNIIVFNYLMLLKEIEYLNDKFNYKDVIRDIVTHQFSEYIIKSLFIKDLTIKDIDNLAKETNLDRIVWIHFIMVKSHNLVKHLTFHILSKNGYYNSAKCENYRIQLMRKMGYPSFDIIWELSDNDFKKIIKNDILTLSLPLEYETLEEIIKIWSPLSNTNIYTDFPESEESRMEYENSILAETIVTLWKIIYFLETKNNSDALRLFSKLPIDVNYLMTLDKDIGKSYRELYNIARDRRYDENSLSKINKIKQILLKYDVRFYETEDFSIF